MVEKQILKMKFFKIIEYWNIGIVFVWKNRLFNLAFVNLNELKMNWTRLKNLSHDHSRSWTKNQQKYEPDSWTELNWTEMIADLVHFFPSLIRVNPDKTSVTEHLFLVHEYISEYITGVNQSKNFKACYLPIDTYTRVEHIEECRLTRLACTVLSMSQGTPKENVFIQQRQSCHIKSP